MTAHASMCDKRGKCDVGRAVREVDVIMGKVSTCDPPCIVRVRVSSALSVVSLLPSSLLPPPTHPPALLPSFVSPPPLGLLGVVPHLVGSMHPTPVQSRHDIAIVVDVRTKPAANIRSGTPTPMVLVVPLPSSRGPFSARGVEAGADVEGNTVAAAPTSLHLPSRIHDSAIDVDVVAKAEPPGKSATPTSKPPIVPRFCFSSRLLSASPVLLVPGILTSRPPSSSS